MLDKKILLATLLIAIIVGVVVGILSTSVFPEWASENRMTMLIAMGAFVGVIYPLLVRKKNSK